MDQAAEEKVFEEMGEEVIENILFSKKGKNQLENETDQSSNPSLKVLIVTPVYPPNVAVGGGVAITYGVLTEKLRKRGHYVTVISPRKFNVDFGNSILYPGFPVMFPTISNLRLLVEQISSHDILVCPDNTVLPFLSFLCNWLKRPLVFNIHTNVKSLLEQSNWVNRNICAPFVDTYFRIASHMATLTLTTSPSYHDVLVDRGFRVDGVFSPRLKLGVFEHDDSPEEVENARLWLSDGKPEKSIMIYAGRLSHEKRIPLVIESKPDDAILAIVGDGPLRDEFMEKFHNPKNGVIVRPGMQSQDRLRVLYKASDLLVSASAFETLGMTVAEGHVCGIPAAVQPAPGFVTQIVPGKNGELINYETCEEAKLKLSKLLRNLPTRNEVLRTTQQRWDSECPNLEEIVEELAIAASDEEKWNRGPMPLFWILIVLYWIFYNIMSFPFNTLTNRSQNPPTLLEPIQDKDGNGNGNGNGKVKFSQDNQEIHEKLPRARTPPNEPRKSIIFD